MWKRFLSLSRIQQIAAAVCLVHLLLAAGLSIHHLATRRLRPAKPIAVRTLAAPAFATRAAAPVKKEAPKQPAIAKSAEKPLSKAAVKQETPKTDAAKKTAPAKPQPAKEKAAVKKTAPEKAAPSQETLAESERALADLAESLKKISEPEETNSARTALVLPPVLSQNPLKIAPKIETSESFETDLAPSYEQFLIAYLQTVLDLPEYGEVKIEIEIDRFGNLLRCAVLESRSAKNGEFLKKRLPELSFPCFNDFGITDLTLTFNIAFRNVETH